MTVFHSHLTSLSTFSRGYGYLNPVPGKFGNFLEIVYSGTSYSFNFYTATQKSKKKKKKETNKQKPPT